MKKNTNHHTAKSISSHKMEDSEMKMRIMNLGKDILKELGLERSVDTPSRWMSHYIAEKIVMAENSAGIEKATAEQYCFETILKLWDHRSSLPEGCRPFDNFKPIFQALDRLNPENDRFYYFQNRYNKSSESNNEVEQWIDVAMNIDKAARSIIEYVLKQASLCATDGNTIKWLDNSLDILDNEDISTIRILLSDSNADEDEPKSDSSKMKKIKALQLRIDNLEFFNKSSQILLVQLRKELEML